MSPDMIKVEQSDNENGTVHSGQQGVQSSGASSSNPAPGPAKLIRRFSEQVSIVEHFT